MFCKVNKVLLGIALFGRVMSGNCSESEMMETLLSSPTSQFEIAIQKISRYTIKQNNIEISIPQNLSSNIDVVNFLIRKISHIVKEATDISTSLFTTEELNDFRIKAESTNILPEESFYSAQKILFGSRYVESLYKSMQKQIIDLISKKNLKLDEFNQKISTFLDNFITDQRGSETQREACRNLMLKAEAIMQQERIRLLSTTEKQKPEIKKLWTELIIAFKFADLLGISRANTEFVTNWKRFYDAYIK